MKSEFDLLTGRNNPFLKDYHGILVHDEVIPSLKLLQEAAKDEIGADLQLISCFRSYEAQKKIWELKASGKRDIFDDNDNKVDIDHLSTSELIEKIMRFSAIPGASRHHWGTDMDVYDASKLKKEEVNLTPSECGPGDIFCELHAWLDQKIADKQSFGFYRPYNEDLGGVSVEKWHLSFAPIANEYFQNYNLEVFISNLEKSHMLLKTELLAAADFYFKQYVSNINLSL